LAAFFAFGASVSYSTETLHRRQSTPSSAIALAPRASAPWSPGKDKEANWLPAPKGPFSMIMRLYWPKEAATEGKWKQPPLQQVT